jgi:hypothetical protein
MLRATIRSPSKRANNSHGGLGQQKHMTNGKLKPCRISHFPVIIIAASVLSSSVFAADIGIDLKTCMPDGAINTVKEKFDPKKFWIAQNVILEIHLERRWEFEEAMSRCGEISSNSERIKCISYQQNLQASIIRCYQTTKRMCRANGGLC